MNNNIPNSALAYYSNETASHQQVLNKWISKGRKIGWARFLIVLFTALALYSVWGSGWVIEAAIPFAGITLFLKAVSMDIENRQKIENESRLLKIITNEIEVLKGNFSSLETGELFAPHQHPYAGDLDLFGQYSLYQYINRCQSEQGKRLLSLNLSEAQDKERILLQQDAVKELSRKNKWNHQFSAFGMSGQVTAISEKRIADWMIKPELHFTEPYWQMIIYIFPAITLSSILLYCTGAISLTYFNLSVVVFAVIAFSLSKKIHPTWKLLSNITGEIETLYQQLNWLEQESFSSSHINQLKTSLSYINTTNASTEIIQLKKILDRFDVRLNIYLFVFLNSFLLWDLRQFLALQKWKQNNSGIISHWFSVIAEMELSISLARLAFNQPDWCFPEISATYFTLEGKNIGHPLIASDTRVNNDYAIQGNARVDLITGSNMGGKSTFLRSIGVNIVLALMGGPVCAKSFSVYPAKLMSSMRIADNLAESTSTFYAELKKLQLIIEAVKRKETVFILLDEILRGTNSLDKHKGSEALIRQLIQQNTVAILATHDIELTQLQEQYPDSISNYHFDVQVANEELYFDYKLKTGVCKSLNATLLMKKIGINI